MTKQETLPKKVRDANLTSLKHLEMNYFSPVRVLYHQFSITNHTESILKFKIMSNLMIIFLLFFLSDFLKKCNCSLYSNLMTMFYLVQFYAAMYYNHSSMR